MAIYAIGDIQGCYPALQQLLEKIAFDPQQDKLWLVGDLVNRGPESLATLRFVKNLGACAVAVLGNHDLHLLAVAEGYARPHKSDTIGGILDAPDRGELLDWLRRRPLLYREGAYLMVHAGLLPQWTAEEAAALAREAEAALGGANYHEFLGRMYGNEPRSWRDDLAGCDRLRVVVNAMTRMRLCTPEGAMDFSHKGEVHTAPPGLVPWFAAPARASADATIVCGHWSALGLVLTDNVLALDSGCLWGGHLSALRLEDRRLFQVSCAGINLRQEMRHEG